jgi:phosphopantothenate-cysteine ligase
MKRMITDPTNFSAESYFATQPPPPTLEQDVQRVREWIQKQVAAGRKVVLVTVSVKILIGPRL